MKNLFVILLVLPIVLNAQVQIITSIPVFNNGKLLQNPWVGGMNNPVCSPIDLNQDGLMDLFVYDKAGWKAQAYINTGSVGHPSFTYAPRYDLMFPKDLRDWAVIRDYNKDGVPDILALSQNSDIMAYKGYRNGNSLSFVLEYSKLQYPIGNFSNHIWTFADNMPAFVDIDRDGDMDILTPDINGGYVSNYYQNQAVERGYSLDSLVFIDATDCWGGINIPSGCGSLEQNACKIGITAPPAIPSGARHMGGVLFDFDNQNDHDIDLLLTDISCTSMVYAQNDGDSSFAHVAHQDTTFPSYNVPIHMNLFPAAWNIDADNDGFKDLFICPFAANNNNPEQSEDIKVIQYYHNAGLASNQFRYAGDSMITNGIVDVGSDSHPVFFDYNGDGLLDIVIGNYGRFQPAGAPKSGLALYQNTGTDTLPQYTLVDTNWSHINIFHLLGTYPAFGDLDGDGKADMVVGDVFGKIDFFKNTGGATAQYPSMTVQNWFGIDVVANAAPFIYDVNGDGLNDLVIGSKGGNSQNGNNILYYWNFGTATNPMFHKDSVNSFFGHINVSNYHIGIVPGYACPFICRENNKLVLYSGSAQGITFKYAINPDSLRHGTFLLLDSNVLPDRPGLRSTVYVADINHDGRNDYLTGNIRGGIMLYSDTVWKNSSSTGISDPTISYSELEVFPVPAHDRLICRLTAHEATLITARLYNLLGESISIPIHSVEDSTLKIDVTTVASGIYILQVQDSNGKLYQHKVSIQN